ncbi:hypothetical protein FALBO_6975 [Fusarium albosuccineum]|uniref:Uncharacterized protein n=1 Tax=Fusarium albosuccineum TaxID=1237068 RepID=A0A8H4LEF2_9HYPO|nr:hypothetical protein FALBO_6975 [Fusarium albosuccineum]
MAPSDHSAADSRSSKASGDADLAQLLPTVSVEGGRIPFPPRLPPLLHLDSPDPAQRCIMLDHATGRNLAWLPRANPPPDLHSAFCISPLCPWTLRIWVPGALSNTPPDRHPPLSTLPARTQPSPAHPIRQLSPMLCSKKEDQNRVPALATDNMPVLGLPGPCQVTRPHPHACISISPLSSSPPLLLPLSQFPVDFVQCAGAFASPSVRPGTALGYLSLTWSPLHHLRGEQAATALEANLSNLESKLDAILARLDAQGDSQSSTPPAATKAEHPVKASDQADGNVETQVDVDTDKGKGKEDSA